MKGRLNSFSEILIACAVGVLVISAPAPAQSPKESDLILRTLLPNGTWGDASQLVRFNRHKEIRVLLAARVHATGYRATAITFLLAALHKDYSANLRRLIDEIKDCDHKPYPQAGECTYEMADYLMDLCRRGDSSLLHPIFRVSNKADGAFSQSLGGFYSDMLNDRPAQFVSALARYRRRLQEGFCWSAGREDGSGMNERRYRHVTRLLNDLSSERFLSIAPVAKICLTGVRNGYKEAISPQ
jgi:hypothetical protein